MIQAPIDVPAKNEDDVQVYIAALFEARLNGYRSSAARKRAWRALINHRKQLAKGTANERVDPRP